MSTFDKCQNRSVPSIDKYSDLAKRSLGWLIANGQSMRWVTEQIVIRQILESIEFRTFFGSLASATTLDVGCGGARYLLDLLAPRSSSVIGVEYSRSHTRLARLRIADAGLASKITIVRGSAEELPVRDGSVDFALCTQVLEHLPSPRVGIEQIARALRPGGRGLFSIPIPPDPVLNPEHLHSDFTPMEFDKLATETNLTILRRAFSMYALSRVVAWLVGTIKLPLPLNPLCYLEQATSSLIAWPKPHVYICVVEKQRHS